jgi:DNA-binding CsgD family transcriptional regulator
VVRIASPTFVGRAAELAALDEALEAAAQGQTRTVLIGGDAGVGKTRFLETWNDRARESGARVVTGACLDLGESGPAYVAVVQAFRDLLGSLDPVAVDQLLGSDRSTLARVIPELLDEAGPIDDAQRSMPIAQTRLFNRLAHLLEGASTGAPLVIELEDVHWADPSTRSFLVFLVANVRNARLLIIPTFRAEEAGRAHPLTALLRQLDRDPQARRIDLQPFDIDELRGQLRGILGESPTNKLLAAIHARSEGNPLFAEELIASGDPVADLPSSIGAALLSRTAGLSAAAQGVLRVASVAGRTVSYDVLESATALPDEQLGDALREAVGVNILEPEHAGERYRFRHALLQETIYRETLPGERRRLHGAVAGALGPQGSGQPLDPEIAPQLAHHWFMANDLKRALKASVVAGDSATGLSAHAEAVHHYERVLDLWERAPLADVGLSRATILRKVGRSAFFIGLPAKTIAYGERALSDLDEVDDPSLRVAVLDDLRLAAEHLGHEQATAEYERRLADIDAEPLPPRDRMKVLGSRVMVLRRQGDRAGAAVVCANMVKLAERLDDPESEVDAHLATAWALIDARDFEGVIREARRGLELAATVGNAEAEVEGHELLYEASSRAGRLEEAISEARLARSLADRLGLYQWEGNWAALAEASALFELGRLGESLQVTEAALLDPSADRSLMLLHLQAARTLIVFGSLSAAQEHLNAAEVRDLAPDEEPSRGYAAIVSAELAEVQGRLDDVRRVVRSVAPGLADAPPFSESSDNAWALIALGLDAEAVRAEQGTAAADTAAIEAARSTAKTLLGHVDEIRRQRDATGIPYPSSHGGYEALIAGHLARIENRDDPALWMAAAAEFPSSSVEALTARYRQAEAMLATKGPRDEVTSVMAEAHAKANEIGARPLADRFEALARRARIHLRTAPAPVPVAGVEPAPNDADAPGSAALRKRGLSHREIEVLTLVAAGFSNHEIGTRLFISDKTASVHVSHILNKLDVASRTEAATIGVRLGLPDVDRADRPG